ncbi:hypothetical protein ASPSYDRAFT_42272 [Aspergillus sydowii CBS 593.65]|uniref:Uncharacterized protein n=1 Tax=Aspergillus sydowii CBS 593.65 TaxID=1036612 RepID=A0A1L9TM72_9EURO|nr:uncharacterized protein ASPSYDRAFT_42272 [Aspergillus sydowii CBS 593.65]OJJ60524.1 hypothetical protein ASPSYDRAFT_42272 [Aspergillus sydowii CBS 593.65]
MGRRWALGVIFVVSICAPAGLTGIYGFYPSIGRISGEGPPVPSSGNDSIPETLGTFMRTLRDISLFCTASPPGNAKKTWPV